MIARYTELIIPDYDPISPKPYPGNIKPGYYSEAKVKKLLKKYKDNPGALQFLRDMMAEWDEYKHLS